MDKTNHVNNGKDEANLEKTMNAIEINLMGANGLLSPHSNPNNHDNKSLNSGFFHQHNI